MISRYDAGLRASRVFPWRLDSWQPVFDRDFNAEPVETAARVFLHVAEVVRVHELAMRIERAEHAFQRGGDQIVIAGFISVDVILANQLDRFGEHRDLRVSAVLLLLLGAPRSAKSDREKQAKSRDDDCPDQDATLHLVNPETDGYSLIQNFWQRPKRRLSCAAVFRRNIKIFIG